MIEAGLELETRSTLPDALRVLLADYPRDAWDADPGFSDLIRFWLDRHLMFRRVVDVMSDETEQALDADMDPQIFASHLGRYGGFFVQELHAHHTIEDQQYFPKLKKMDDRIGWGFDLLDRDHHEIDGHLQAFAEDANRVLQLAQNDPDMRPGLDQFQKRLSRTKLMLDRHLTDEEELVVPVLLKHAPSGLV